MKSKWATALGLVALVLAGLTCSYGCDDDDDVAGALTALMHILHLDADRDGVPDTYQYQAGVVDESGSDLLGQTVIVTLPDGSTFPLACADDGSQTLCVTALLTPPAPSGKANIPAGLYRITADGRPVAEFTVAAADLDPAGDPAGVDLASLNPATPGNLPDPAVLDWQPAALGPAGNLWEFSVANIDAADDNGQSVSGTSADWASSNFSLDLPDTWDLADPLLVGLVAVGFYDRGTYLQIIRVQSLLTGYVFGAPPT